MRVEECRSSRRESVHVWRLDLRMPVERPYPVVQIIDGDHDDVRLFTGSKFRKKNTNGDDWNKLAHTA